MKQQCTVPILALSLAMMYNCTTAQTASKKTISTQINMDKQNYTATILVDQRPQTAFEAIKNFRAWWSEDIEGETGTIDQVFFYHYKDIHLCKLKLIEAVPGKRLIYSVIDNQFSFTQDKSEWVGTKLIFEIAAEGAKTRVQFTHEGLVPAYECYRVCYDAWGNYINNSLYNLITTGKGAPNPKDKDGFNAQLAAKWKIN
ncbi:MAG: SRPBCC domain-containing protein [Chitinophagaceae bacterium]